MLHPTIKYSCNGLFSPPRSKWLCWSPALLPEGTKEAFLFFLSYRKIKNKDSSWTFSFSLLSSPTPSDFIIRLFSQLTPETRFKCFLPNIKKAKQFVNKRLNHFYETQLIILKIASIWGVGMLQYICSCLLQVNKTEGTRCLWDYCRFSLPVTIKPQQGTHGVGENCKIKFQVPAN